MSQSVSAYAAPQPPNPAKPAADRVSQDAPRFDDALLAVASDGLTTPGPKLQWMDALLQEGRGRAPRSRAHPDE